MKAHSVTAVRSSLGAGLGVRKRIWSAAGLAASLCLVLGCSSDDDEPPAIAGDSGTVEVLGDNMATPTTVAIRAGNAWVPEGQFTRLPGVGMDTTAPAPFVVRSVGLSGSGIGATSISLPGNDFYPEGIAADPDNGDLYVGSVTTGKIVKVPNPSTTAAIWLDENVLTRGAVGMTVDKARGLLWVCDSGLGTGAVAGGTLVGVQLSDKVVKVKHDLSPTAFCNDVIVDDAGNIFVTETSVGQVYKIAAADALTANKATVWLSAPDIAPPMGGPGANGLVLVGQRMFIANTSGAKLVRVDPSSATPSSTATVVSLTLDGAAYTLSGPDGLTRLSDNEIVVVENGLPPPNRPRVVKITLDTE